MATNNYWMKTYFEILTDPKMGNMDDHLWRRTLELFLLAGSEQNDGILPNIDDIAWHLRTTNQDIEETLAKLQKINIIASADGKYYVKNYNKRQAHISDAERMRSMRDRKRSDEYYQQTYGAKKHDKLIEQETEINCCETDNDLESYGTVTTRKTEKNRIDKNRIDVNIYSAEAQNSEIKGDETIMGSGASDNGDPQVTAVVRTFEQETGKVVLLYPRMYEAVQKIIASGISMDDYASAIREQKAKGYTISGIESTVNFAVNYRKPKPKPKRALNDRLKLDTFSDMWNKTHNTLQEKKRMIKYQYDNGTLKPEQIDEAVELGLLERSNDA